MLRISNDILSVILSWLRDYIDLLNILIVCKKFHNIRKLNDTVYFDNNYCQNSIKKIKRSYPNIVKLFIIDYSMLYELDLDIIKNLYIFNHVSYYYDICLPDYSYTTLTAISLHNYIFNPDMYFIPNLEFLHIYNINYKYLDYIPIFDVNRFPKLIYINLTGIFIKTIIQPLYKLEFINFNQYDILDNPSLNTYYSYLLPNIKYILLNDISELTKSRYCNVFPTLQYIIDDNIGNIYIQKYVDIYF